MRKLSVVFPAGRAVPGPVEQRAASCGQQQQQQQQPAARELVGPALPLLYGQLIVPQLQPQHRDARWHSS